MPARSAVERQQARKRQRSAAAPRGISAARPTLSNCNSAASEAREPSRGTPRKKKCPAPSQLHSFAKNAQGVGSETRITLPGETGDKVSGGRDAHDAQGRHHGVRRTAQSAEAGINKGESCQGERKEKYEKDTEGLGNFGHRRRRLGTHSFPLLATKCERVKRTSPRISTPMPAAMNKFCAKNGRSSTKAAKTMNPPRWHHEESGNFHSSTPSIYQNKCGANGKPSVRPEARPIDYFYRT